MTRGEKLRRQIKAGQELRAYSNGDMAIKMHMSLGQYNRRLGNPEKITFGEMVKLEKILHINLLSEEVS